MGQSYSRKRHSAYDYSPDDDHTYKDNGDNTMKDASTPILANDLKLKKPVIETLLKKLTPEFRSEKYSEESNDESYQKREDFITSVNELLTQLSICSEEDASNQQQLPPQANEKLSALLQLVLASTYSACLSAGVNEKELKKILQPKGIKAESSIEEPTGFGFKNEYNNIATELKELAEVLQNPVKFSTDKPSVTHNEASSPRRYCNTLMNVALAAFAVAAVVGAVLPALGVSIAIAAPVFAVGVTGFVGAFFVKQAHNYYRDENARYEKRMEGLEQKDKRDRDAKRGKTKDVERVNVASDFSKPEPGVEKLRSIANKAKTIADRVSLVMSRS